MTVRLTALLSVTLAVPAGASELETGDGEHALSTGPANFELHFEITTSSGGFPTPLSNNGDHLADVNGDGRLDLIHVRSSGLETRVALGAGDGTFVPAGEVVEGFQGIHHRFADLNGDGFSDWITTDFHSDSVSGSKWLGVRLGNGIPGSWWRPPTAYLMGPEPNRSTVGDLDGDGYLDVAASFGFVCPDGVTTFVNDGTGMLAKADQKWEGETMLSIAIGDADHDGLADVVSQDILDRVYFFEGRGDGALEDAVVLFTDDSREVAIADLTGDGLNEILSRGLVGLELFSWNEQAGEFVYSETPLEVSLLLDWTADYDRNGHLDLFGYTQDYEQVILPGSEGGSFGPAYPVPAGYDWIGFGRTGDVDGDGWPDRVGTNPADGTVLVYLNESMASPWSELPGGIPGVDGNPRLAGHGVLLAEAWTRVDLESAAPDSPGALVLGSSLLGAPLLGGVLLPFPDHLIPITTDALGELAWEWSWPAGTAGSSTWFQAWVLDDSAGQGWSASNGLAGAAPK